MESQSPSAQKSMKYNTSVPYREDLIAKAKAGDEKAFTQLVKEHQSALKSFLYRLTTRKGDTEDLMQETFIRAFQKIHSFKEDSSFRTWLFAIATNLARDHFRAQKRWPVDAQDKCKALISTTPEYVEELKSTNRNAEFGKYEIKEHIDFCFTCIMKTLPLEQHVALMLAEIYLFKVAEIAEIMGTTIGAVKHRLHDARKAMQNIFEGRCALINKQGICHQCSELNGFNNAKAETQRIVAAMDLARAAEDPTKHDLFALRVELVRAIDPLNARGTDLHDFLLMFTRKALQEE